MIARKMTKPMSKFFKQWYVDVFKPNKDQAPPAGLSGVEEIIPNKKYRFFFKDRTSAELFTQGGGRYDD